MRINLVKNKIIYQLILIVILSSCNYSNLNLWSSKRTYKFWINEHERISSCRDLWIYDDLGTEIKIKVLYYQQKQYYSAAAFPNFIIGLTNQHDTLGIIDFFSKKITIKIGDSIIVKPCDSIAKQTENTRCCVENELKESIKPLYIISKYKNDNNIFCSVKYIYYGIIDLPDLDR